MSRLWNVALLVQAPDHLSGGEVAEMVSDKLRREDSVLTVAAQVIAEELGDE